MTPTTINTSEKTVQDRVNDIVECCNIAELAGHTLMYVYKEDVPSNSTRNNNKSILIQMFSTKDPAIITAITGGVPTNMEGDTE